MYFSIFHWLPLLNGHTGFAPWQYRAVEAEIFRVWDPRALQALVDLTGLRWILVRRSRVGPDGMVRWERFAAAAKGVVRMPQGGDDALLLQVTLEPRRPWAAALARPWPAPGRSALGTPLAPLDPTLTRGRVEALAARTAPAEKPLTLTVSITNDGREDWPALVAPGQPDTYCVQLTARWQPMDGGSAVGVAPISLPRDVAGDDRVSFQTPIVTPRLAGAYTLDLGLAQAGAGALRVAPARVPVTVESPAGP
jgi:hypothetical protein